MNLFKLLIPKDKAQEVTELESWTISWRASDSLWWSGSTVYNKCFINNKEAKEFKKQLEASAKFIKTPINTELNKN